MAVLIVALQAYLGFTFLGAAYGKARSAVRGQKKSATATLSLVLAETVAGVALLAGLFTRTTALAVAAFLAVGVVTKAFRRWRNAHATCVCVGQRRRINAAELTAGCVQVAAATAVVALADDGGSVGGPRMIGGVALALAYLVAAAGSGVLRSARLRPGQP